jgi:hypothetical protein
MTDNNQKSYDPDAPEQVIARLSDNTDLVDVMIAIEDYLDSNDLYTFKNWINGEIVAGPFVKKYWVKVTLKWPHNEMPDPSGGLRLLKHGTKIAYKLSHEEVPVEVKSQNDYQPGTKKPRMKKEKIWLVELTIPRRFVESINKETMDLYDEEVDLDTADEAVSQGATPEQATVQS